MGSGPAGEGANLAVADDQSDGIECTQRITVFCLERRQTHRGLRRVPGITLS
jgi:hypothetical protein